MAAAERLGVRPVGKRHLDLDKGVARAGLGPRHLGDQVAQAVVEQGSHGVKTTFASWER